MNKKHIISIIILFFTGLNSFSQSDDKNFLDRYEMKKVFESDIGIYFAQKNTSFNIKKLDSFLLSKTDSISRLFNHKLSGKVQFEFYPSQAITESVCGWDTSKTNQKTNRIACAHYINKIQLVIPGSSKHS